MECKRVNSVTGYDYLFKVLLVGDSGTGKSSLMGRFVDEEYTENFVSTIGVDFKIRTMTILGKIVKLQIWDTAGQDRFRSITQSYYHGAHGILVVFDVTNRDTFDHTAFWFSEISQHANVNVTIALVGNKCDLGSDRTITDAEAQALANSKGLRYLESSAKTGANVPDCFEALVTEVVLSSSTRTPTNVNRVLAGSSITIKSSKNCC